MSAEYTAVATIDAERSLVWDVLTDPTKLGWIVHFGEWHQFDRSEARPGAVLRGTAADGSGQLARVVVNWDPPHRFSVGLNADDWVWDFTLDDQAGATRARYACRYRQPGWLEAALESLFSDDSSSQARMQEMTDQVLQRLAKVCSDRRQFGV